MRASTLWTGPNMTFTQSSSAKSDVIVSNVVVLSRGNNEVLYNTAAGETSAGSASPKDTLWAFATTNNYLSQSVSYKSMSAWRSQASGDLNSLILNKPMMLHITNLDIYIPIMFTSWPQFHQGGFTYIRATPGAVAPPAPSVTITNPANNTTLAAPASFTIDASASVAGGAVTNVAFFTNGVVLAASSSAPFVASVSALPAGDYALAAIATAAGLSATSSVVNVSVVNPAPVAIQPPAVSPSQFSFSYSANPGLSYVVQSSTDVMTWTSISTNVANSSTVPFADIFRPNGQVFYRVYLQPNP